MKKFLTLLLCGIVSAMAWAGTFSSGWYNYTVLTEPEGDNPGTVEITGPSASSTRAWQINMNIHPFVSNDGKNYRVTSIGESAFEGNENVMVLTLNYGIEEVKANAFKGCPSLKKVRLPSSMKNFGEYCFASCERLSEVYFATSREYDDSSLPENCFERSQNTLERIMYVCLDYEMLYVPTGFTDMERSSEAYDILANDGTQLVVSKASTSPSEDHECKIVGYQTYTGDATTFAPTTGRIKPSDQDRYFKYVSIVDSAFNRNTTLKKIDMSNVPSITRYGMGFAANCPNLTDVKLVSGAVGEGAFRNDAALCNVDLDGVTSLGYYAFQNCTSLVQITIPASVNSVSSAVVFDKCSNLETIDVASGNPYYFAYNNALYTRIRFKRDISWSTYEVNVDAEGIALVKVPEGYKADTIMMHPETKFINGYSVSNFTTAKQVEVPYGVVVVFTNAFRNSTGFTRIELPSSVKISAGNAFYGCENINEFYFNGVWPYVLAIDNTYDFDTNMVKMYLQRRYATLFDDVYSYLNIGNVESADYHENGVSYTVTSTQPEVINGKQYDGRARVVRGYTHNDVKGEVNIPESITLAGKQFAVTLIDTIAFSTPNQFSIVGCANVDTVGLKAFEGQKITGAILPRVSVIADSAFRACTSMRGVAWGSDLKQMGNRAFAGSDRMSSYIYLPVGMDTIGAHAFDGVNSKEVLIPSTTKFSPQALTGMSQLRTIVLNTDWFDASQSSDLSNIPANVQVLVPLGLKNKAQAHADWGRFARIESGSYDFCEGGSFEPCEYVVTVTSTDPVTMGGKKYDGKAKVVYNAEKKGMPIFGPVDGLRDEMQTVGDRKIYLITEVDDSCFVGSTEITTVDLTDLRGLTRVGKGAFYGCSNLQSVMYPTKRDTTARLRTNEGAFMNCPNLHEIVMPELYMYIPYQFFGNNASDFMLYLHPQLMYQSQNSSNIKKWKFNDTEMCMDHIAPCFVAPGPTYNLGAIVPLDLDGSGLDAYAVTGVDGDVLTTRKIDEVVAGQGVIITDLEEGHLYKVHRWESPDSVGGPNLLKAMEVLIDDNLYTKYPNSYYWDLENQKFVKPTKTYNLASGLSYLELPNGASEYYLDITKPGVTGDVNGDGVVDVTDVNFIINTMLSGQSEYNCDVNSDGVVDVTDVNQVINIMLNGK